MAATGSRAVRFDRYGDKDVLYVADVPMPTPAAGEVVVAVRAAGINPGRDRHPLRRHARPIPGDVPLGTGQRPGRSRDRHRRRCRPSSPSATKCWASRCADRATLRTSRADGPTDPQACGAELGGSRRPLRRWVHRLRRGTGRRAQEGRHRRRLGSGGGVGTVVVQLLGVRGAQVLGIASPANAEWLTSKGAVPVPYGDGLAERLRAAAPTGSTPSSTSSVPTTCSWPPTSASPATASRRSSLSRRPRNSGPSPMAAATASTAEVLAEMADLVASGAIEIPIAATYPLEEVADAFEELGQRHTRGKIVLIP